MLKACVNGYNTSLHTIDLAEYIAIKVKLAAVELQISFFFLNNQKNTIKLSHDHTPDFLR